MMPILFILCLCSGQEPSAGAAPAEVFDDFVGPAGSPPDQRFWDYDPGAATSGEQIYTTSADNVGLDGDGHLVIRALRSDDRYTSGRLITRGKVDMLYGRVSARIKMPSGQGIWPAFWLLGSNYATVGWPECGEVDIMELVNSGANYHVTLHGPQNGSDYERGAGVGRSGPIADLTTDFHIYWMSWQPDAITIGVDDTTLGAFTPTSLPPGARWVFDQPMFAVLNVAVGGGWPGPPTEATVFPAVMVVDWFRYTP